MANVAEPTVTREQIVEAVTAALQGADYVQAAWFGGSDATGRTDGLSDVDLQVLVPDERVEDVFPLLRGALEALSPIAASYRMPEPAWHGMSQEFFLLRDSDPTHLLDLAVIPASKPAAERFLEPERHGRAQVIFDRGSQLEAPPLDWDAHLAKAEKRLATLRATVPLFAPMAAKGARRGHLAEAVAFYQAFLIKPLVEILRMRHCPERYDYGLRYLDRDLPAADRALVERLSFPADRDALLAFCDEARARIDAELAAQAAGDWALARPA